MSWLVQWGPEALVLIAVAVELVGMIDDARRKHRDAREAIERRIGKPIERAGYLTRRRP